MTRAAFLLMICVLALIGPGARAAERFVAVAPHAVATDAPLAGRDGAATTLGALLGREPGIVHVWATWCAPCRHELPALAAFLDDPAHADLSDRVLVIALDTGRSGRVFSFLDDDLGLAGMAAWHATPDTRRLSASLRLRGIPATYVISAEGAVVAFHAGPLDWTDPTLADELAALISEGG